MSCAIKLSERTTWGRTQIIDEMDKIEKRKVREIEENNRRNEIGTECTAITCPFRKPN